MDQDGVLVDPRRPVLRDRHVEAGGDELPALHVELPDLHGVGAAGREVHQTVPVLGSEAAHAPEGPGLALGGGQGVDVQDRLPVRIPVEVVLPGRAAVDPPRVLPVGPEVVEPLPTHGGEGDPLVGGEDRHRVVEGLLVCRERLEFGPGLGVVLQDPLHGAVPFHLLQPEPGILLGRHRGAPGDDEGAEEPRQGAGGSDTGGTTRVRASHHRSPASRGGARVHAVDHINLVTATVSVAGPGSTCPSVRARGVEGHSLAARTLHCTPPVRTPDCDARHRWAPRTVTAGRLAPTGKGGYPAVPRAGRAMPFVPGTTPARWRFPWLQEAPMRSSRR